MAIFAIYVKSLGGITSNGAHRSHENHHRPSTWLRDDLFGDSMAEYVSKQPSRLTFDFLGDDGHLVGNLKFSTLVFQNPPVIPSQEV